MFEVDPADKWEFVSAALQAAGTIVSFLAAVAAWFAAVASKRAVREMAAARHQYVKPVLVLREPANIAIDLGVWRDDGGAGYPSFEAEIALTNVGKGPAFGVECLWLYRGSKRAKSRPVDVASINKMLASSDVELIDDERQWTIRKKQNHGYFWNIIKSDFYSKIEFLKISEGETVNLSIPYEMLGLQVIHSLNKKAEDFNQDEPNIGLAYPGPWHGDELDGLIISYRSISDDPYEIKYSTSPSLGDVIDARKSSIIANLRIIIFRDQARLSKDGRITGSVS